MSDCLMCGQGQDSPAGSTKQTDCFVVITSCPKGMYSDNNICVNCPENTYKDTVGVQLSECLTCGEGFSSPAGSTSVADWQVPLCFVEYFVVKSTSTSPTVQTVYLNPSTKGALEVEEVEEGRVVHGGLGGHCRNANHFAINASERKQS